MKLGRTVAGLSLLSASCWFVPFVADLLGVSELFGYITVGSLASFAAGILFWSGVKS